MRYGTDFFTKKIYQATRTAERGFELVEIVIATGIISLTLVSIIAVGGRSLIISRTSLEVYTASTLLEEGAEAVRIVRNGAWADIMALTPSTAYYPYYDAATDTWTLSSSSAFGTIGQYTRSVVMTPVNRNGSDDIVSGVGADDPGTKFFVETVSWHEPDGSTRSRTLSFYLSDIL